MDSSTDTAADNYEYTLNLSAAQLQQLLAERLGITADLSQQAGQRRRFGLDVRRVHPAVHGASAAAHGDKVIRMPAHKRLIYLRHLGLARLARFAHGAVCAGVVPLAGECHDVAHLAPAALGRCSVRRILSSIPILEVSRSFAFERIVFASRFISCAMKSSLRPIPLSSD